MSTRLRSTRGLPLGATALVALAAVGAGFVLLQGEPGPPLPMAGPGSVAMSPAEADPVRAAPAQAAQLAATPREAAPACPFQQLEIALAGAAPLRACVDATRVQQNGGVRSYGAAGSGTAGWALQVDVAGGAVLKASLQAGDGRRFGCEGGACAGLGLGRHDARGLRSITLSGLLLAGQGEAADAVRVSGRLAVPADDLLPGLACSGPSVAMNSPDGSAHKFCGQGGAGVEIADGGLRHYRFEDAEGRSLAISVNGERRVTRIEYGGLACSDSACTGASVAALAPESELSERSFFFGRTALYDARSGRAQLLLDGSLTLPSQE